MRQSILFIAAFILTACATQSSQELASMEKNADYAVSLYDTCISQLNTSIATETISSNVLLANHDLKPSKLTLKGKMSPADILKIQNYNKMELECFADGANQILDIDPTGINQIMRDYAAFIASVNGLLLPGKTEFGEYNNVMSQAYDSRFSMMTDIVNLQRVELTEQVRAERQEFSNRLSAVGASLSAAGQANTLDFAVDTNPSTETVKPAGCFLKERVSTPPNYQCVYSCMGKTHVVSTDDLMCPISLR